MTDDIGQMDRADAITRIAADLNARDHWLLVAGGEGVGEMLGKLSGPLAGVGTYYCDIGQHTIMRIGDAAVPAAAFLIGIASYAATQLAVIVALPKSIITFDAVVRAFELGGQQHNHEEVLGDVIVMCDQEGGAVWPTILVDALLLVNPAAWQTVADACKDWEARHG